MKKIYFLGILSVFFTLHSFAADSTANSRARSAEVGESTVQKSSRWKASASSYYYSFEGTKAAQNDIYSFGPATLAVQILVLSYDIAPGWTVLGMGSFMDNYVETSMPIPGAGDLLFKDRTLGWNDALIDVVHPVVMHPNFLLFGDIGLSLPTGSISKKNPANPLGGNYAYNMQLGSGTFDLELGAVGIYLQNYFQIGSHLSTFQRLGSENRNGYKLGNLYKGEGWVDVPAGFGLTPRLVGYYKVKQAIKGMDATLGRNIYTEYYYHDQQNWDLSAALKFERKLFGNTSLMAEAGKPIAQGSKNSDQVIVSTNYYGNLGISGTF